MTTTAFAHGVEGIDYSSLLLLNTLENDGNTATFDSTDSHEVLPLYAAKPALDDDEEDEDEDEVVDDDDEDDDLEDDDLDDDDLDDEDDDLEDDEDDDEDEDDEELEDDDDPKPLKVKSRG